MDKNNRSLIPETAADRLLREFENSPAEKLRRQMALLDQSLFSGKSVAEQVLGRDLALAKTFGSLAEKQVLHDLDRSFATLLKCSETDRLHRLAQGLDVATGTGLFARNSAISEAIKNLQVGLNYNEVREFSNLSGLSSPFQKLGLAPDVLRAIGETTSKFSILGGVIAGAPLEYSLHESVRAEILGTWHTGPDLSERFWDDRGYRSDLYRDAGVDEGLVDVEPRVAVQVMVESGYLAETDKDGASAAVVVAGVHLGILIDDPEKTAGVALSQFERALRNFIATKMEIEFGPRWMVEREGPLAEKAKVNRRKSYSDGEPEGPLINWLDIGDLLQVVTRKGAWNAVFEPVFRNKNRFTQDILAINALRRPSAHFRVIDAPILTECIFIMQRNLGLITDDGEWLKRADSDF